MDKGLLSAPLFIERARKNGGIPTHTRYVSELTKQLIPSTGSEIFEILIYFSFQSISNSEERSFYIYFGKRINDE